MDVNKLCFGCMKEKENPGQRCPRCGFDINEYMQNCSARVLRPGTILNGQYLVGKVLGEGGFGITYLAFDLNVMMAVAIKEYFPSGLASRDGSEKSDGRISAFSGEKKNYFEHGLNNFVEEVRKLMQFRDYEGIVKVNTLFYENGTAYMVMEYIRGKSLKQYLQEKQVPLSEAETLAIMKPVLRILGKVHESGVIHRDVSPDNIMLGDNGKVYLIDFGAARMVTGAETKSLDVMLKPGYTPFEQYYSKGNMGPWTDVYAVCATMYRMMSGKVPQESLARIDRDQQETLYALSEKREIPSVSQRTSQVVEKGMSLKTEDRYQNIYELIKDLNKRERNYEQNSYAEKNLEQENEKQNEGAEKTEPKLVLDEIKYSQASERKWKPIEIIYTLIIINVIINVFGDVAIYIKDILIGGLIASVILNFLKKISRKDIFFGLGSDYFREGDYEKAVEWFEKGARKGDGRSQYALGYCYHFGKGVVRDFEEAVKWYKKAVRRGESNAQQMLEDMRRNGLM